MGVTNFNDTLPAAPPGKQNVKWQADPPASNPRNESAYVPDFVGDSGTGGIGGGVPRPSAGDTAQGKFLSADGFWEVPSGIYELPVFLLGAQTLANQILIRIRPARAITFPAGLTRSTFTATVNATAATVFSVQKNDVQFGTITVGAGTVSALFSSSSASINGTTDILSVVGPASGDATLANIGIVLTGTTVIENRFASYDEDFWINPVRPVPASMFRSPLFRDPEEVPAGVLLKSVGFEDTQWPRPITSTAKVYRPLPLGDPDEII